jgi:hypothetical protein
MGVGFPNEIAVNLTSRRSPLSTALSASSITAQGRTSTLTRSLDVMPGDVVGPSGQLRALLGAIPASRRDGSSAKASSESGRANRRRWISTRQPSRREFKEPFAKGVFRRVEALIKGAQHPVETLTSVTSFEVIQLLLPCLPGARRLATRRALRFLSKNHRPSFISRLVSREVNEPPRGVWVMGTPGLDAGPWRRPLPVETGGGLRFVAHDSSKSTPSSASSPPGPWVRMIPTRMSKSVWPSPRRADSRSART